MNFRYTIYPPSSGPPAESDFQLCLSLAYKIHLSALARARAPPPRYYAFQFATAPSGGTPFTKQLPCPLPPATLLPAQTIDLLTISPPRPLIQPLCNRSCARLKLKAIEWFFPPLMQHSGRGGGKESAQSWLRWCLS